MRCKWGWLVSVVLTTNVWAGEAGWTEPVAIKSLEASQQGRFVLRLHLSKSISGCRSADSFYADYGRDGSELMYTTALEALRNHLKVQVYVTGGCDLDGYSAISSVRILP
jgi:hypothetical protein